MKRKSIKAEAACIYTDAFAPRVIKKLPKGYEAISLHGNNYSRRVIVKKELESDEGIEIKFFILTDEDGSAVRYTSMSPIGRVKDILSWSMTDDYIAVGTSEGLKLLVWNGSTYHICSQSPPPLSIDYGVQKAGHLVTNATLSADASSVTHITGSGASNVHPTANDTKSQMTNISESIYAIYRVAEASQITTKGYFNRPFMIRHAYRMADGSHFGVSDPVLIEPDVLPPRIRLSTTVTGEDALIQIDLTANKYFELRYRIVQIPSEIPAHLIQGVDIYISELCDTYIDDPKGSLTDYREIIADSTYEGHYSEAYDNYIDHYTDRSVCQGCEFLQPNTGLRDDINRINSYHLIASIDWNDIRCSESYSRLNIVTSNPESISKLRPLEESYNATDITATAMTNYDGQLAIATPDGKVYTTARNNPLCIRGQIHTGHHITAFAQALTAPTAGTFGQFPLYGFCKDGILMLKYDDDNGMFITSRLISNDICVSSGSIVAIGQSIAFATDRGIMTVQGAKTSLIADMRNLYQPEIYSMPMIDNVLQAADARHITVDAHKILRDSTLMHDKSNQLLILSPRQSQYALVYSIEHKNLWWTDASVTGNISGSDWTTDTGSNIVEIAWKSVCTTFILTKPINAAGRICRLEVTGTAAWNCKGTALYGTYREGDWRLIGTSRSEAIEVYQPEYYRKYMLCIIAQNREIEPSENNNGEINVNIIGHDSQQL